MLLRISRYIPHFCANPILLTNSFAQDREYLWDVYS